MKKFFDFIFKNDFGRIIGTMLLSGLFLVIGEKLDSPAIYSIGAILASTAFVITLYILIVSNIGNKS